MSLMGHILAGRGEITIADLDRIMEEAAYGVPTAAGVTVSESNALHLIPVYSCVSLLADTIAMLPCLTYQYTTGGGRRRDWDYPLYPILHDSPNPEMTAFEFWNAAVGHRELWGNAYAEIQTNRYDEVQALWPLDPSKMAPDHWGQDGRLIYKYWLPNGEPKYFHASKILHIRGLGSNGVVGYSPIGLARQALGLTRALEDYGARFFGNDSRPGGVLSVEGTLKKEGREALKQAWEDAHRGLEQKWRIAVLDAGAKWQAVGMPNEDAQFLETRKYQDAQIAKLYRIPPHMIGDTERTTSWGTGIEHMSIGYVTYTLDPRLESIEQRAMLSLMTPAERKARFIEFLVDGLLRADAKTRHEIYAIGRQNGYYNTNDIRRKENSNGIGPAGDRYLVNGNMVPLDEAGRPEQPSSRGAEAQLVRVLGRNADRIIRKESAALGKLARRHEGDQAAFIAAAEQFYGDHSAFVAQTLCVEEAAARGYAQDQLSDLSANGPACMDEWPWRRVDDLVKLALGGNDR